MSHKKPPIAGDLYLCFAGSGSCLKRRTFPQRDIDFVKLQPDALYRIPFGASGQYIAYDLRDGYHCTQPVSHSAIMREAAMSNNVSDVFPDRTGGPHHFPGVFSSFNNFDTDWDSKWDELHSKYPWEQVGLHLLHSDAGKKPCERKNFAEGAGYTGINADTSAAYLTARPSVLVNTNQEKVKRMCTATHLLRLLLHRNNMSFPHFDPERNSEFALELCRMYDLPETTEYLGTTVPSNIFEFLTDAALVIPMNNVAVNINGNIIEETMQVQWHLDECNCPVAKLVFVLYKHVWFTEFNCWIRISSIFTFRKAISDYYLRRDRAGFLRSQLVAYYRENTERHDIGFPPTPTVSNMHNAVTRLPCYNKLGGFHSCFATPIAWFIDKYRSILTIEKVCELLVPIGISRGPSLFYRIVSTWSRSSLLGMNGGVYPNKTGSNNLALEYIHATIELGGINAGVGPRHQPKVNGSMFLFQVKQMCLAVRDAVELTYNDPPATYAQLRGKLAEAPYFGNLGAQHIIAAAACVGILRNGSEYLLQGDICPGTRAFECITKSFGLTEHTVNAAYRSAAAVLEVPPLVVEEVGCRLAKECKRIAKDASSVLFQLDNYKKLTEVSIGYDVQFPGQYFFSVEGSTIVRSYDELENRDGTCVRKKTVVEFVNLGRRKSDPWEEMKELKQEVPTSAKSSLQDNVSVPSMVLAPKKRAKRNLAHVKDDDKQYRGHVTKCLFDDLLRLSTRVSTRKGLPFNHMIFAEANRTNKTRVYMTSLLQIICEGSRITKKSAEKLFSKRAKRKKKGYRSPGLLLGRERNTQGVEKTVCRLTHRLGDKQVTDTMVMIDSPFLVKFGLDGHTMNGEAVYRTPRAAARALVVNCLFHMPYIFGNTRDGIPSWLSQHAETVKKKALYLFS